MAPQYVFTMKGLGKTHPPDTRRSQRHLALVSPRRQDWRARRQRRGQVDAAEDHGRRRDELHRRGVCRRRRDGRLPAAGAAAQSRQGREGQRRGRRRRAQGPARSLRRRQHEARRGHVARGDGEGPRRAGEAAGPDRRGQRLGPRLAPRDGDGRAASARRPTPTSRRSPAASAVAWRCAGCCCSRRICCCSTSRPTTSTRSRSPGSSASSRTTPAPSSR